MMKRLNLSLGLFLGLATIALLYVAALPRLVQVAQTPYENTASEIDGAPARDLEVESMRARIADLEADLVAREQDCEDLANALNSAIADRNEAVAILMANGWMPEVGGQGAEVGGQGAEVRVMEGRAR
jgi:hypothetical protein